MIDTCDPEIAGWNEDGESFFIKDKEKFQSEVLPTYFKHSEFTGSIFHRVSSGDKESTTKNAGKCYLKNYASILFSQSSTIPHAVLYLHCV